MMLENYWKMFIQFALTQERKKWFFGHTYVFQMHLLYYLVTAAFSLLWQTWASIFYSEICSVLVESGAFLPFLLSLNVHSIQFAIYIYLKYIDRLIELFLSIRQFELMRGSREIWLVKPGFFELKNVANISVGKHNIPVN